MNNAHVTTTAAPVNLAPPGQNEAAVAAALADLEIILDWTDEAIADATVVVEKAKRADPTATAEPNSIAGVLGAIQGLFAGARDRFETIPTID